MNKIFYLVLGVVIAFNIYQIFVNKLLVDEVDSCNDKFFQIDYELNEYRLKAHKYEVLSFFYIMNCLSLVIFLRKER